MKKLLLLALSIVLISCDQDKEAEQPLKGKITELENQVQYSREENTKLRNRIGHLSAELNNTNYINKEYAEFFLNDALRFMLDKKKFLSYIFEYSDLENNSIDQAYYREIWRASQYIEYYQKNQIKNKNEYVEYLLSKFDRSTENIERFFDEGTRQYIYSLFENSTVYEKSGFDLKARLFIQVYDDIQSEKRSLDKIYSRLIHKEYESNYNYITSLISEEQIELLKEHKDFEIDEEGNINIAWMVFDVYGFWARRHHEGNKEIVYELLFELHENVSK